MHWWNQSCAMWSCYTVMPYNWLQTISIQFTSILYVWFTFSHKFTILLLGRKMCHIRSGQYCSYSVLNSCLSNSSINMFPHTISSNIIMYTCKLVTLNKSCSQLTVLFVESLEIDWKRIRYGQLTRCPSLSHTQSGCELELTKAWAGASMLVARTRRHHWCRGTRQRLHDYSFPRCCTHTCGTCHPDRLLKADMCNSVRIEIHLVPFSHMEQHGR